MVRRTGAPSNVESERNLARDLIKALKENIEIAKTQKYNAPRVSAWRMNTLNLLRRIEKDRAEYNPMKKAEREHVNELVGSWNRKVGNAFRKDNNAIDSTRKYHDREQYMSELEVLYNEILDSIKYKKVEEIALLRGHLKSQYEEINELVKSQMRQWRAFENVRQKAHEVYKQTNEDAIKTYEWQTKELHLDGFYELVEIPSTTKELALGLPKRKRVEFTEAFKAERAKLEQDIPTQKAYLDQILSAYGRIQKAYLEIIEDEWGLEPGYFRDYYGTDEQVPLTVLEKASKKSSLYAKEFLDPAKETAYFDARCNEAIKTIPKLESHRITSGAVPLLTIKKDKIELDPRVEKWLKAIVKMSSDEIMKGKDYINFLASKHGTYRLEAEKITEDLELDYVKQTLNLLVGVAENTFYKKGGSANSKEGRILVTNFKTSLKNARKALTTRNLSSKAKIIRTLSEVESDVSQSWEALNHWLERKWYQYGGTPENHKPSFPGDINTYVKNSNAKRGLMK